MDFSPRLALPYLLPNQAQKHVTHNEALRQLDALVQLSVRDRDLPTPPTAPDEGQCWLVAAGAGGAWAGHEDEIAAWQDGAWAFLVPGPGWRAWVLDEGVLCVWTGTAWDPAAPLPDALQDLARLGVGTAADAANPFAAKLNKALWTARYAGEGGDGDLRYTLNKEAPGGTLSLLMQSAWSGRAEIGLTGDDDLHVKVSPDGAAWTEALRIGRDDGCARFPQGIVHTETGLGATFYVPSLGNSEIWRLDTSRAATPRNFTIGGVSGDVLTLTGADADQIYRYTMRDRARVRVWNVSKAPAEPAWVDWDVSATELRVTDAADIAGWSNGETLRLGDPNPTGDNELEMVAVDIGNYMQNNLGAVFRQKAVGLFLYVSGDGGSAELGFSGSGAGGTAYGGNALADGARNQASLIIPTPVPSPISGSNLLFLRETLAGSATGISIALARILGVYV